MFIILLLIFHYCNLKKNFKSSMLLCFKKIFEKLHKEYRKQKLVFSVFIKQKGKWTICINYFFLDWLFNGKFCSYKYII